MPKLPGAPVQCWQTSHCPTPPCERACRRPEMSGLHSEIYTAYQPKRIGSSHLKMFGQSLANNSDAQLIRAGSWRFSPRLGLSPCDDKCHIASVFTCVKPRHLVLKSPFPSPVLNSHQVPPQIRRKSSPA